MKMLRYDQYLWQDLIEMTVRKMDKDRDGKVSFEDYQATVRYCQMLQSEWKMLQVMEEPLLMEAFGECLTQGKAGSRFRESVLDLP